MITVFFDIDTQNDFMLPAGALYVPGAEALLPAISRLNQTGVARGNPVVSTVDAHAENDPEFQYWPPHCIAGTLGQQKPAETLAGQLLFPKLTVNCFESPELEPLLATLAADRYVVYGVVTEVCVKHAVMGLLKTGKPVEVVTDAIRHLTLEAQQETLAQFVSAGGKLTTLDRVLA